MVRKTKRKKTSRLEVLLKEAKLVLKNKRKSNRRR